MEQVRLLGDDPDDLAERRELDPPDVDVVDLDGARVDVVQPRDQVGRRRLAASPTARRGRPARPARPSKSMPSSPNVGRSSIAGMPSRASLVLPGLGIGQPRPRAASPPAGCRRPSRRRARRRRRRDGLVGPARRDRLGRVLEATRRGSGPCRGSSAWSSATASGASTISGSISRYSKIRSNRASAPWISTWTLSSWPSGKKSRLWSVVNATMSPIVGASGSPLDRQVAGQPVHERRRDAEDRADDHEEPAADHRLADLERGQVRG